MTLIGRVLGALYVVRTDLSLDVSRRLCFLTRRLSVVQP